LSYLYRRMGHTMRDRDHRWLTPVFRGYDEGCMEAAVCDRFLRPRRLTMRRARVWDVLSNRIHPIGSPRLRFSPVACCGWHGQTCLPVMAPENTGKLLLSHAALELRCD